MKKLIALIAIIALVSVAVFAEPNGIATAKEDTAVTDVKIKINPIVKFGFCTEETIDAVDDTVTAFTQIVLNSDTGAMTTPATGSVFFQSNDVKRYTVALSGTPLVNQDTAVTQNNYIEYTVKIGGDDAFTVAAESGASGNYTVWDEEFATGATKMVARGMSKSISVAASKTSMDKATTGDYLANLTMTVTVKN